MEPRWPVRIASCVSASTPGRHAHERSADARLGRARGLVERVEDDERAGLGRGRQLLVGLVVAVHEQPLARDPGPLRERELAERGDVGADALLGEQPHQRDVRERLRPVDDERVRNGPLEQSRPLAERALANRRRAAFRSAPPTLVTVIPLDLQHPVRDPGSPGEQC